MKQTEQAPGTRNEYAGANVQTVDKDSDFPANLPYRQRIIYELLLDGVPRSAADITIALRVSDPRSAIRDMRKRGIAISDEWLPSKHGSRFKRYSLRGGGVQ